MAPAHDGRRHPTWLRVVLVALQAAGVAGGLVLGNLTYDAWSEPDDGAPAPPTTVAPPEAEAPLTTLG